MEEEKIQVWVTASETVYYEQTVTITKKEWERIKRLPDKKTADEIEGYLDKTDVSDSSGIEPYEFEAYVVDKDGNELDPQDAYTGDIGTDIDEDE